MSIEERTRLAIIGEELEDEIMSKATALRDLADSMVEQTGAVDEKQLRPLIDEIGELKTQYRAVLGGVVRSNAP
ncbi:hypothetical protein JKP88DRAFT_94511 [Tribonema minus]|uniref:Uncharacterized protein n=2 Tax=Tribonema minus TaxID=303371 RepID=A0A835YIM3_9STRA|nr:hypothetical protein JKP88DRAFT_94511 [Tribonema minus]